MTIHSRHKMPNVHTGLHKHCGKVTVFRETRIRAAFWGMKQTIYSYRFWKKYPLSDNNYILSDKGRNLDMEPAACLRTFSFLITMFQVNLEKACDDFIFKLLVIQLSSSKTLGKVIIAIRMHFLLHFVYGFKVKINQCFPPRRPVRISL